MHFFSTAQPKRSVAQTHHVVLPSADSEVPTELQCDIQPGALAQRYSVQWRRLYQSGHSVLLDVHVFSLMLNATSGLDGSQYQCEVTINHDGSLSKTYNGSRNTILISSKTLLYNVHMVVVLGSHTVPYNGCCLANST